MRATQQLGRYQLLDLVTQDPGLDGHADVTLWRGYDEILDRNVAVRILDADDPRCAAVLGAAQAAARVDDRRLLRVLDVEKPDSAIIFCNTREETGLVAEQLRRAGLDAEPISSDLTQKDRERVMGRMRARNLKYLVATDIAHLKAATAQTGVAEGFLTAASPGLISLFFRNDHYQTSEAYLAAIADAPQML